MHASIVDLVKANQAPHSLFDRPDPKDDKLIEAFDAINERLGPGSIQFGRAAQAAGWQSSSAFQSPVLYDAVGGYPVAENLSGPYECPRPSFRKRLRL